MSAEFMRSIAEDRTERHHVREIARLGGIATTQDLRSFGLDDEMIRISVRYGALIRLRHGWYALPQLDREAALACVLGGRLACRSALRHLGLGGAETDGRLHIEVPGNAVSRVPVELRAAVRVHWARNASGGDRASVDAQAALRQAERCR